MYCPDSISSGLRKQGSRPNLLLDIVGVFVAWHLGLFACWLMFPMFCPHLTTRQLFTAHFSSSDLPILLVKKFLLCWSRMVSRSPFSSDEKSAMAIPSVIQKTNMLNSLIYCPSMFWHFGCASPPFWWVDLMIPAATVAYVRPRMLQSCCCSCPSSFRARCCWNMWRSAVALSKAWESMSGLPFGDGEMKFTSKICLEDFGEVKRNITGIT